MSQSQRAPDQSKVRNRLLRLMAAEDYALIRPHLSACFATRGDVWFAAGEPIETVWFKEDGIVSLVTISPESHKVESGICGFEGFAPVAIALDSPIAPYDGQVQMPGRCWNMPAAAFLEAIDRSSRLHRLLLRYVETLNTQIAYTSLSNAVHAVDERLARWLLMCHDRIDGDELLLTHDFLATMLAIRRPSVTTALHVLEGNGFIRADRGCIRVRDRAAMEEFAADGYGTPEREYARLLGPMR